jgi:hypothetical protein
MRTNPDMNDARGGLPRGGEVARLRVGSGGLPSHNARYEN